MFYILVIRNDLVYVSVFNKVFSIFVSVYLNIYIDIFIYIYTLQGVPINMGIDRGLKYRLLFMIKKIESLISFLKYGLLLCIIKIN